jgi:pimeloyl-ACP methyl ester carboxylesterase
MPLAVSDRPVPSAGRQGWIPVVLRSLATLLALASVGSATPAWAAEDEDEPIKPTDVELVTADGVVLTATWYASKQGKDAVPVVLLHMFGGSRSDYHSLASLLHKGLEGGDQAKGGDGYAVLVPDLRGHGDSTHRRGRGAPLKATTMARAEFSRMVTFDMQRIKSFLLEKNNAGQLSIEKLVVVGAEMGASVAVNWARLDWSVPLQGNRRQAQDVKVLVLISPQWSTKGLPLQPALRGNPFVTLVWDPRLQAVLKNNEAINFRRPYPLDFRREVAVKIYAGSGKSSAVKDAKRVYDMLKPYHGEDDPDLSGGTVKTSLQGTKMLNVPALNLDASIAQFIQERLESRSLRWAERKNPYAQ